MAGFTRTKNYADGDTLTAADYTGELDNIINNLTPAMMDDESASTTAMRATADPYPAAAESLATTLQGELQRLRYVIAQITGETYWYVDPDNTVANMTLAANNRYKNLTIVNGSTAATQVTITADWIVLDNGTYIPTVSLTLTMPTDLDTGTEENAWYYIWLTSASAGKLSKSATAPTGLTGGKFLAGAIYNSTDFISISQKDNKVVRAAATVAITTGSSGSPATYDISASVPATAKYVSGYAVTGEAGGVNLASTVAKLGLVRIAAATGDAIAAPIALPIITAQTIYGYPEVANGNYYITGWEY